MRSRIGLGAGWSAGVLALGVALSCADPDRSDRGPPDAGVSSGSGTGAAAIDAAAGDDGAGASDAGGASDAAAADEGAGGADDAGGMSNAGATDGMPAGIPAPSFDGLDAIDLPAT
jgi:hypothetical protein